ncbi:hypothetical protein BJY04DRAFT_214568 [Aspergillus karnatakaensis]|uniref:uncharacterized protein n=1 Tax=Aspergillus karnatakaensis TaxID=1810916 RepID=UPI003CCD4AFE
MTISIPLAVYTNYGTSFPTAGTFETPINPASSSSSTSTVNINIPNVTTRRKPPTPTPTTTTIRPPPGLEHTPEALAIKAKASAVAQAIEAAHRQANAINTILAASAAKEKDTGYRRRTHSKVRNLLHFPGAFEQGSGISAGADGFIRPAQGWIAGSFEFRLLLFVRPEGRGGGNGYAARMFYQVRMEDLAVLERGGADEDSDSGDGSQEDGLAEADAKADADAASDAASAAAAAAVPAVGDFGFGLWLAPASDSNDGGTLKFGYGKIVQVFHDAMLAVIRPVRAVRFSKDIVGCGDADLEPVTGFAGRDPNPRAGFRGKMRFR